MCTHPERLSQVCITARFRIGLTARRAPHGSASRMPCFSASVGRLLGSLLTSVSGPGWILALGARPASPKPYSGPRSPRHSCARCRHHPRRCSPRGRRCSCRRAPQRPPRGGWGTGHCGRMARRRPCAKVATWMDSGGLASHAEEGEAANCVAHCRERSYTNGI